jgi:hypothetical protein
MGSHYALEFVSGEKRQLFFSDKGLPPSELMTLFRPCDRAYPSFPGGAEDDDEPYIPCHAYQVPVPRLIERLEIMGFTIPSVQRDLERCLKAELRELDRRIEVQSDPDHGSIPGYLRELQQRRRLFQNFTLERWSGTIRRLRTSGMLHRYGVPKPYKGLNPLQRYILNTDEDWEWHEFGFPTTDLRYLMRALLLCAYAHERVLLDLSELEIAGYIDGDEQPVVEATAEAIRLGRVCEKILVLTEGRTDTRILAKSLNVLYPHVADMYSFLDHEAFHFGGGTGNLASLVKGLAGVGIGNRVIAVFDNDTAGTIQAEEVRKLNLPENFRILTLPDLKFARRYPTLGPNGALPTDINGRACSIELYLGTGALTGEDGTLVPVQWKGYESKLQRYQGELIDEKGVEQRYRDALDTPGTLDDANLEAIRAVLQMIFAAFADKGAIQR